MFTKMLLGQEKAGLKKQQRYEPMITSPQTKEGRVTCKECLSLKHLKKLLYPVTSRWSVVWSLHSEPPFYLCFTQSRWVSTIFQILTWAAGEAGPRAELLLLGGGQTSTHLACFEGQLPKSDWKTLLAHVHKLFQMPEILSTGITPWPRQGHLLHWGLPAPHTAILSSWCLEALPIPGQRGLLAAGCATRVSALRRPYMPEPSITAAWSRLQTHWDWASVCRPLLYCFWFCLFNGGKINTI